MASHLQRLPHKSYKIYAVPVGRMRRAPELVTQRKFRQAHASKIAAEFDPDKFGLPVLNLRDGHFWILDGQHRIAAIKEWGYKDEETVDCQVYEDLSDREMADMFLGRDARKAIPTYDKFFVACTAERVRECDIRRAVESNGAKIGRTKDENTIRAVGALGRVYDLANDVVLGQVVRAIKNAYGGDYASYDRCLIEGLGLVFNRYNGRTNEKEMAARLGASNVRSILRRAEALRERTGNQKTQCVAATVVDIYNKPANRKQRLPDWWKSGPKDESET